MFKADSCFQRIVFYDEHVLFSSFRLFIFFFFSFFVFLSFAFVLSFLLTHRGHGPDEAARVVDVERVRQDGPQQRRARRRHAEQVDEHRLDLVVGQVAHLVYSLLLLLLLLLLGEEE